MLIEPADLAEDLRVAVVASRFNEDVTERLLQGAVARLEERGVPRERIDVGRVPGAFEIPAAARALAETGRYGAVVCVGAVIRGETPHFDHISRACSDALMRLALEARVALGFGLLTCDTDAQAEARAGGSAGNKGAEAADAALDMVAFFEGVRALRLARPPEPAAVTA